MDYRAKMRWRLSETQVLWAIIAVIGGIDAVWAHALGLRIVLDPMIVAGFALIAAINLVYTTVRPNERIAALAGSVLQLAAFTAVGAVLSYLTVTSKFPLIDHSLAAADSALGLDWLAAFNWVQDSPTLNRALTLVYLSAMVEVGVLLVAFNVIGTLARAREFVWLFVLTLLIIIPISWLFPAESAWVYFGVTDRTYAYHLADFTALRNGQMPAISMSRVNGLITFPSFHAALGLILVYTARGIRIVFPVSLVLNTVMIASTPTAGGHYFVDIFAGLATVPVAVLIFRWWQPRQLSDRRLAAAIDVVPATGGRQ